MSMLCRSPPYSPGNTVTSHDRRGKIPEVQSPASPHTMSDKSDRWGDNSSTHTSGSPEATDLSGRREENRTASPGVTVKEERRDSSPEGEHAPVKDARIEEGYAGTPPTHLHPSHHHHHLHHPKSSELLSLSTSGQYFAHHIPPPPPPPLSSISASNKILAHALSTTVGYHHNDGSGNSVRPTHAMSVGASALRGVAGSTLSFEGAGHLLPTEDVEVFFNHLDNRPTATTVTLTGYAAASGNSINSSSTEASSFASLTNASLVSGHSYHNGDVEGGGGGSLITLQPPSYSETTTYLPPMPSLLVSSSRAGLGMGTVGGYSAHGSHHAAVAAEHSGYSAWGIPAQSEAPTYTPLPPASSLTSKHGVSSYLSSGDSGVASPSEGERSLSLSRDGGYMDYVTNEGGNKWSAFTLTPLSVAQHEASASSGMMRTGRNRSSYNWCLSV